MTEFQESVLASAARIEALVQIGVYALVCVAFIVALVAGLHLVRSMRS